MSKRLAILSEPELEFRFQQRLVDPRDGLALFGPYDSDSSAHPRNITHGVIGTAEGIAALTRFSGALCHSITESESVVSADLWRPFPGFDAAFCASWPNAAAWEHALDREVLLRASRHGDPHKRAFEVVELYLSALDIAAKRDEEFDVLFCVVPEEVFRNCRPQSKVRDAIGAAPSSQERAKRAAGQIDVFGSWEPEQYLLSVDFRRQLKARAMKYDVPLQVIRESTLRLTEASLGRAYRDLTPLSDRAWNICTTAFYKAGGKPWRLSSARPGVCYIGLVFRQLDPTGTNRTACCAAQMFLDTGDGVVFKGEYGPWYSPRKKEYHLDKDAASQLLTGVLQTYRDLGGQPLTEIFLHSRSGINREEFHGYTEAASENVKVVGIRVRTERREGAKLFRPGTRPVIRGTLWTLNERSAFLWGSGFVPRLRQYPGWEVPVPLRIDIQHGDADILQVATDIFGLTKLNYNACRIGDSEPVTIGFSDKVGEILVANPGAKVARPQFKYYI